MEDVDPLNSLPASAHVSDHDPWEAIGQTDRLAEPVTGGGGPGPSGIELQQAQSKHAVGQENALAVIAPPPRLPPPPTAPISTYTGSGWTIPLLCLGLGLIACCILIPQADANRRLAYEKQMLQADLASVKQQANVNGIFLKRVADDPALAERLAERQMKMIRAGTKVLPLDAPPAAAGGGDMSPFQITAVAPPPPSPPYQPVGGTLASACYDPHCRLYLIGGALLAIAAGLVLGQSRW